MRTQRILLTNLLLPILACSTLNPEPPNCVVAPPATSEYALSNVHVVDVDRGRVLFDQFVTVQGKSITAVTSSAPDGVELVDGCGAFVSPGLIDMHVHARGTDLPLYLAAGVTTVRHMWGYQTIRDAQAQIEAGTLAGPTIYSISPGLDGSPPEWPFTELVDDPSQARAVVGRLADDGWRTLKMYQRLTTPAYDSIVVAARALGLEFVGHVPDRVGLAHVLESGQRSIEHLSGYADALVPGTSPAGQDDWARVTFERLDDVVEATFVAQAWNCPTMNIYGPLTGRNPVVLGSRRRILRALSLRGAKLLVGTDSGIGINTAGQAIHEELAEFRAAGISAVDALRSATVLAAEFLGARDQIGEIAAGKRADMVLTEGNPLEELATLRSPLLVVARGVAVHR